MPFDCAKTGCSWRYMETGEDISKARRTCLETWLLSHNNEQLPIKLYKRMDFSTCTSN